MRIHIDAPACPRPAPRRHGSGPLPRAAIRPISSTGCKTPVSLLAIITLINRVLGRNALRTSSDRDNPLAIDRQELYLDSAIP